jgi:CxxC-x17-CxxC domain-containing protein
MKKRLKLKSSLVSSQADMDIAGLLLKIQQQLSFLDKKIDTLIAQGMGRSPVQARVDQPRPPQRFDQAPRRDDARPAGNFMERVMHKAICAECRKECEVPFRPSGGRPVYCKECFSKRKASEPGVPGASGGADRSFRPNIHERPGREDFSRARHGRKHEGGENRKSYDKKKPVFKKRKRSS